MAYPAGLPTTLVDLGSGFDFFGPGTKLTTNIYPVLGGPLSITHTATGFVLTDGADIAEPSREIPLPRVAPEQWTKPDGTPAAAWSYRIVVNATATGHSATKWEGVASPVGGELTINPAKRAESAPAAAGVPRNGSRTIVFGDSVDANTQGWFPYWAVESGLVPVIRNAGISGNTTNDMIARMEADVIAYSPDVVILGGSTNDQGFGVTETITRGNITTMVDRVVAAGATPVLRTTPPTDLAGAVAPWDSVITRRKAVQRHNTWLKGYARSKGIHVLDVYAACADPSTGGFKAGHSSDGLHPSESGSKAIADWLIAAGTPPVFQGGFLLGRAFNEDGNLVSNGVFHDTDGNGIADQWYFTVGTGTGTTSVTAGESGIVGNWQRVTSAGAETVAITHDIVRGPSTYALGDVLEFQARVRTSGGSSARVQVMAYGGSGSVDAIYNASEKINDGIVTQRMIPQDEANLRVRLIVQVDAGAAGWLELAEVAVRNLTRLGLA